MKNLSYLLLFFTAIGFGQVNYLLPNEEVIYSFDTKKGKKVVLAKDATDKYIVYRFGTKNKIELEYPKERTRQSWSRFTYSGYLRGGGIANLAKDLDYLAFTIEDYKYVIYSTYIAEEGDKLNIGVKVLDSKTDKLIADIKGKESTQKGNLAVFNDSKLINRDEEEILYD